MRLRNSHLLILIISFFIIAMAVSTVSAGRFGGRHMPFGGKDAIGLKTFIELNLTETQKIDALKIIDGFAAFRDSKRDVMQQARDSMKAVMQAEPFDEQQAREAFREAAVLREDLFVQRAKMMAELKAILTPEQLELLKKKWTDRHAKFKEGLLSRLQDSRQ